MINDNIKYLNKDFTSYKNQLIEFAKTYYPQTYSDFNESSPGMMFIEMISYVGDILSFYQDYQIQENYIPYTKQRKNLFLSSYLYGYFPKVTNVSNVILDVYQLLPSIEISGSYSPNFNYCISIDEGCQIQSSENTFLKFIIEDRIDFSQSSSLSPTEISVYSLDGNNNPEYYLLKKQHKAYSADVKTITFDIGNPERFKTLIINDDRIIKILDIQDSDGNYWYEVPYLSQSTIFDNQKSSTQNSPSVLKLKSVPNRFISRFKSDNKLEIQFGSGLNNIPSEEIIPNPQNIGLGLPYGTNKLNIAYDPSNFMYSNSYGEIPSNTTLTVRYLVGGGISSNAPSNTLTLLSSGNPIIESGDVNPSLVDLILDSLTFNNENPGIGGGDGDTDEDLRQKILSSYSSQLRTVTSNDYIIRSMSMPSEYGLVSKAYVVKDTIDSNTLSLYVLSKNSLGNLETANKIIKNNLITYLEEYRSLTDSINIKDAFIINIGVEFDIILRPNYNNKVVINNCINDIYNYFNIDKWSINQPIILTELYTILDRIEGVQTVKNIKIINKSNEELGYSKYIYDIPSAMRNNIIYPSMDPSIFELKYITDIKGRTVSF